MLPSAFTASCIKIRGRKKGHSTRAQRSARTPSLRGGRLLLLLLLLWLLLLLCLLLLWLLLLLCLLLLHLLRRCLLLQLCPPGHVPPRPGPVAIALDLDAGGTDVVLGLCATISGRVKGKATRPWQHGQCKRRLNNLGSYPHLSPMHTQQAGTALPQAPLSAQPPPAAAAPARTRQALHSMMSCWHSSTQGSPRATSPLCTSALMTCGGGGGGGRAGGGAQFGCTGKLLI